VIERRPGDQLLIELGGVRKSISGVLTPQARESDYVIVHVGHAIGMIDPVEAARTLAVLAEAAAASQGGAS
jgi:hydrogenase expression/formation protein HypC